MATFVLIACPLRKIYKTGGGFIGREIEIMSARTIRRNFEASSVVEAQAKFNQLCNEIKAGGESWNAWADVDRNSRAPRGFRQAKDHFRADINPDLVTADSAY